jgi:hypothetical protein
MSVVTKSSALSRSTQRRAKRRSGWKSAARRSSTTRRRLFLRWLDDTGELIWASERDGHNHLYLVDLQSGTVKTQVTKGAFNVRSVDHIDSAKRVAWVRVMGARADEDPYHFHLARVNLDGTGFKLLTEGDGTHAWQWSPDRRWLIDTWSRVDQPPVMELRSGDGERVCKLETADASELLATGWRTPERFHGEREGRSRRIFTASSTVPRISRRRASIR